MARLLVSLLALGLAAEDAFGSKVQSMGRRCVVLLEMICTSWDRGHSTSKTIRAQTTPLILQHIHGVSSPKALMNALKPSYLSEGSSCLLEDSLQTIALWVV